MDVFEILTSGTTRDQMSIIGTSVCAMCVLLTARNAANDLFVLLSNNLSNLWFIVDCRLAVVWCGRVSAVDGEKAG